PTDECLGELVAPVAPDAFECVVVRPDETRERGRVVDVPKPEGDRALNLVGLATLDDRAEGGHLGLWRRDCGTQPRGSRLPLRGRVPREFPRDLGVASGAEH